MTSDHQSYDLAILETSDLHCNIVPYDYYNDVEIDNFGLAKIATLIKKFRKIYKNNLLVDNGDLLQGSALAEVVTRIKPLKENETHPIIKVMNLLKYDLATLGNHDFNYGLEYLFKCIEKAKFPYICSNVYKYSKTNKDNKGKPILPPTFIVNKKLDKETTIKLGFIAVTPPQIMIWDKQLLTEKVVVQDMVESTKERVQELKKEKTDLIFVLAHSGIIPLKYNIGKENVAAELCQIQGIDAVFSGHAHGVFPGGKIFNSLNPSMMVDNITGKINNIPVVMPGAWGSHLGIILFKLQKQNKKWKIINSTAEVHNVKAVVADSETLSAVKTVHNNTLKHIRSHVGESLEYFYSWFSTLEPSLTSQIIQETGIEFAQKRLQYSKFKDLPIICSFAPVNVGNHGSPFIQIKKGSIAIKDISNLYPFDNELKVVLSNGEQIKEWLEFSAQIFQQIDPSSEQEIYLINKFFPSFNFDCMFNLEYKIDVTMPLGKRISDLSYQGKPLEPKQQFAVVTNNFRASGGGNFPNFNIMKTIFDCTDLYRDILIQKIQHQKEIKLSLVKNWSLKSIPDCKAKVIFETSNQSIQHKPHYLTVLKVDEVNKRVKYRVDMTKF